MDKILIHNLKARGRIGMSDKERSAPQELRLNVEVYLDTRKAGQSDDLAYSVDYSKLTKELLSLVEANARHTVEALAEDLAIHCLRDPLTNSVKIRLEKTSAMRFTDAVGVEIIRGKETA